MDAQNPLCNMLTLNQTILKLKQAYYGAGHVGVAISGGADSVALLHLCLDAGLKPVLLHVNYGLRKDESQADELFVRQLARLHKLKFSVLQVRPDYWAKYKGHGKSTQQLARQIRYRWFLQVAHRRKLSVILVAHQLDDQLETIFLNLRRGTGIAGLTGIANRLILGADQAVTVHRPLLRHSKSELVDYLSFKGVSWREDSSNAADDYLRNKIRHQLIEPFKQLTDGNFQGVLSRTLETLKFERTVVERARLQFEQQFSQPGQTLYKDEVCFSYQSPQEKQDLADQLPFLRHLLNGVELSAKSQDELLDKFRADLQAPVIFQQKGSRWQRVKNQTSEEVSLHSGSWRTATHLVVLDRQRLFICPLASLKLSLRAEMPTYNHVLIDATNLPVPIEAGDSTIGLKSDKVQLRAARPAQSFKPFKGTGSKSVADALQEAGVARHHKQHWPILVDEYGAIVWLVGIRWADHSAVDGSEMPARVMSWFRI